MQNNHSLNFHIKIASEVVPVAVSSLELGLERGELIHPSWKIDSIVSSEEAAFLCSQKPSGFWNKIISFNPVDRKLVGSNSKTLEQLLIRLSQDLICKTQYLFPSYNSGLQLIKVGLNNTEAATKSGETVDRDDLLHIDTCKGGFLNSSRMLKLSCNIDPTNFRVWEKGPTLFHLFNDERSRTDLLADCKKGLFRTGVNLDPEFVYAKISGALRQSELIQKKASRKLINFPSQSCWLAMTDVCLHSTLRGSNLLELVFMVRENVLSAPELSVPRVLSSFLASHVKQAAA